MAATFNTLNFTRRLKAAGVPAAQAEAFADALSEDAMGELATKSDLAEMRRDLSDQITATKADIAEVRRDLVEQGKDIRAEMRDLENRLVIKLGGIMAVIAGLLFAGLKLSH